MVCTGCCGTLDYVVTFLFKMLTKKLKKVAQGVEERSPCLGILKSHPEIFRQVRRLPLTRPDSLLGMRGFSLQFEFSFPFPSLFPLFPRFPSVPLVSSFPLPPSPFPLPPFLFFVLSLFFSLVSCFLFRFSFQLGTPILQWTCTVNNASFFMLHSACFLLDKVTT